MIDLFEAARPVVAEGLASVDRRAAERPDTPHAHLEAERLKVYLTACLMAFAMADRRLTSGAHEGPDSDFVVRVLERALGSTVGNLAAGVKIVTGDRPPSQMESCAFWCEAISHAAMRWSASMVERGPDEIHGYQPGGGGTLRPEAFDFRRHMGRRK